MCTLFWRSNSISEDILLSFQFLRVINLSRSGMKELSASMGKLRHLRYLDFSYSKWIEAMPDSICKNCNLQTLRANNCYFLRELPYDMGNMISLRHIYCNFPTQMPINLGTINLSSNPIIFRSKFRERL